MSEDFYHYYSSISRHCGSSVTLTLCFRGFNWGYKLLLFLASKRICGQPSTVTVLYKDQNCPTAIRSILNHMIFPVQAYSVHSLRIYTWNNYSCSFIYVYTVCQNEHVDFFFYISIENSLWIYLILNVKVHTWFSSSNLENSTLNRPH